MTGRHLEAERRLAAAVEDLDHDTSPAAVSLLIAVTVAQLPPGLPEMCEWGKAAAAGRALATRRCGRLPWPPPPPPTPSPATPPSLRLRDEAAGYIDAPDDAAPALGSTPWATRRRGVVPRPLRRDRRPRHYRGSPSAGRSARRHWPPTSGPGASTAALMLGDVDTAIELQRSRPWSAPESPTPGQMLAWALLNLANALAHRATWPPRSSAEELLQLARELDESVIAWTGQPGLPPGRAR